MHTSALFWVFIIIFCITAIITLLGITNVIKDMKDKYLTVLFSSLILEVVGGVVILFNSTDFKDVKVPSKIYIASKLVEDTSDENDLDNDIDSIKCMVTDGINYHAEVHKLQEKIKDLENEASLHEHSIDDFYHQVGKLEGLRIKYKKSINLVWKDESKKDAFQTLYNIYTTLGRLEQDSSSDSHIIAATHQFKKDYGRPQKNKILTKDIPYFITDYLKRNYELDITLNKLPSEIVVKSTE